MFRKKMIVRGWELMPALQMESGWFMQKVNALIMILL